MPKDQQQHRGGDTCMEACAVHPHKTVEYFCTHHDELGCIVCMTNHHNCKGVEHIPDIANDIPNNVEYKDIKTKIVSITQVTTTAIQTLQDQMKRSQTYHTNVLDDFKQFKKDLSKAVDRLEKTLIQEADTIKAVNEKKVTSSENQYKDVLKDMQALSSKFTSLETRCMFCQMFIAIHKARREIDEIESRVGRTKNDVEVRKYRLVHCREMQLLLDSPESMVKLEVVVKGQSGSSIAKTTPPDGHAYQTHTKTYQDTDSSLKQNISVSQQAASQQTISQQGTDPLISQHDIPATQEPVSLQPSRENRNTRVHHFMDIKVRSNDDRDKVDITGCVVLPGDKLVVVDRYNHKVKLIDLTHDQMVSQLKLSCKLWDITQVTSTKVAVTSNETQTIYFVNVSSKLNLDRKVKVKGQCRGIAYINDKFVVSYDKPVKVEIISMKGKVLQTVVTENKGRELFTRPWYVAVGRNQHIVYISDWGNATITRVDLTDQVQATYKDDKLRVPCGLTVDSAGRVYVCGQSSHNILQLTADLTEVQELLQQSDGIAWPYSVYYCEVSNKLYIGSSDNDTVKMLQLT